MLIKSNSSPPAEFDRGCIGGCIYETTSSVRARVIECYCEQCVIQPVVMAGWKRTTREVTGMRGMEQRNWERRSWQGALFPGQVEWLSGKWLEALGTSAAVISTSSITAGESAGSALTQRITRVNGVSGEYMGEREFVLMGVSSAMGTFVQWPRSAKQITQMQI